VVIRLRALAERVRGSLYYVPVLYVVAAAALVAVLLGGDEAMAEPGTGPALPFAAVRQHPADGAGLARRLGAADRPTPLSDECEVRRP
jgi:hypothetical protein